MAYLYRPMQTKPVPPGAEFFERKGERHARWTDTRGRVRTAPVRPQAGGGPERLSLTSPYWRVRYRDGAGVLRDAPTGCRDRVAAERVMSDLVRRAELVRANVLTAAEDAVADHADVPVSEHVDGYVAHLTARGCAPRRVDQVGRRLRRVAADCGFGWLSQLNTTALERWLVARQGEGMAAATRNGYREAAVGFGNWCRRTHRLIANPFQDVPQADVRSDRRRVRRALTEAELQRLLDVARRRPLVEAMTVRRGRRRGQAVGAVRPRVRERRERAGRERALIYKTLVLTGLRKGELASITVAAVHLDAAAGDAPPHIVLAPADDKSREGAHVPLRADLADDLRAWLADELKLLQEINRRRQPGEPVPERLPGTSPLFNVPSGLIRILDRDLVMAGIARQVRGEDGKVRIDKTDERGRTFDVHALRTTFGTHLSKAGVPLRTAQAAMRHSKSELTANVYTDPKLLDVLGAINALTLLRPTGIAPPVVRSPVQPGDDPGRTVHEGEGGSGAGASEGSRVSAAPVNERGPESTGDAGPFEKRATGPEPSTFTSAR